MSNTAEALAALHAAEAELEAALAAEKVAPQPPVGAEGLPPGPDGSAPIVETVSEVVVHSPPLDLAARFHIPDTPFSHGEDVPPSAIDFEPLKPKWLVLPGYLGPIAINGT